MTTIMVTHDQEEALSMADRVVVMNEGGSSRSARRSEVYERPATPFVADFLGKVNVLKAVCAWRRPLSRRRAELVVAGDGSPRAQPCASI